MIGRASGEAGARARASRRRGDLARAGAASAVVAGAVISADAAAFLAIAMTSAPEWPPADPSAGYAALMVALTFAPLLLPVALLVAVLGLYALLDGGSAAARWGLGAAALSALLLALSPVLSYLPNLFYGAAWLRDPGPGFIQTMLFLTSATYVLHALLLAAGLLLLYPAARRQNVPGASLLPGIALATVLVVAVSYAVPALGLPSDGSRPAQTIALVSGVLWVLLGAMMWRRSSAGSGGRPRRRRRRQESPRTGAP